MNSSAARLPRGTVKCCVVTALRSLRPAKPTSNGLTPTARASSRATHSVFAPRLRTLQQRMRTLAARGKPKDFVDFEVFGRRAQYAGAERLTPGGRRRERRAAPVVRDHAEGSGVVSNNTMACAARPSLRPMKPRCSVVVALMFTWFSVTPSICASERRISRR